MCNVPYKCADSSMSFGNRGPRKAQGAGPSGKGPPWLRLWCWRRSGQRQVRYVQNFQINIFAYTAMILTHNFIRIPIELSFFLLRFEQLKNGSKNDFMPFWLCFWCYKIDKKSRYFLKLGKTYSTLTIFCFIFSQNFGIYKRFLIFKLLTSHSFLTSGTIVLMHRKLL